MPAEISQAEVESYKKDGFYQAPGSFSPKELAEFEKCLDDISLSENGEEFQHVYRENPLDIQSNIRRIENICVVHESFDRLSLEIADMVACLFGEKAVLFKDKINFKYPGGEGYEAHRDGQFWWKGPGGKMMHGWNEYAREFINAAIFLDDTSEHNGCLEIAKGKHIIEDQQELSNPDLIERFDDLEFSPIPANAGDIIFFNAMLPHRSKPNNSDSPRRVIFLTYNRASEGDQRQRYFSDKAVSVADQGIKNFYR